MRDNLGHDRIHAVGHVLREPRWEIDCLRGEGFEGQGVAVEEIGDDSEVAARGEAVGHQLGVLVDAEDVAEDDDGFLGRGVGGARDVGGDCGMF